MFQSTLAITDADETIVIDFKNSNVLGRFHHRITDSAGNIVAEAEAGIESASPNSFLLRH